MRTTSSTLSRTRLFAAALAVVVLAGSALSSQGQEAPLRAERVVDYTLGRAIALNAKVGPVSVQSVEFSDRGRDRGGLVDRLRGAAAPSEASTTIRSHFLVQNPSADDWQVTFSLEFLDKGGKLIDKVTAKSGWEGEAKPFDLDHPLLTYVLPEIARVRIALEARID